MPSLHAFPSRRIDDPRSLRVVAALEAVGAGRSTVTLPAMSASFRDDLRTQLVAVTPRLVAEGVVPGTEAAPQRAGSRSRRAAAADAPVTARRPVRTRPMTVLVAGAAVVVLGLGGATWLARNSLPGDALYGLKRTAEGVDVSLSGSDLDKGHALLVDAQTRVEEVNALLGQPQSMALGSEPTAAGALSANTVKLIVSTLHAADIDTQKGVTTIGDDAVQTGNTAGLTLVANWAGGGDGTGGQSGRITSLVDRIPAGAAHDGAEASRRNIAAAYARAKALLPEITHKVTCARDRDQFGPMPCGAAGRAPGTPAPVTPSTAPPTRPTGSAPGGGPGTAPTTAPATTPATTPVTTTPAPAVPTASATRSRTAAAPGGGVTGAVTSAVGSRPVVVDSCGIQVSLPVAGVSLGTCTPGR